VFLRTIRSKLLLSLTFSVLLVGTGLTLGASWMTTKQIRHQNEERIHAAITSMQRSFLNAVKTDQKLISDFCARDDVARKFNTAALLGFIEDDVIAKTNELRISLHAKSLAVYLKEEQNPNIFTLRIISTPTEGSRSSFNNDQIEQSNFSKYFEKSTPAFRLVSTDEGYAAKWDFSFVSLIDDPNYGLKKNDVIGKITVENTINLDLAEMGKDLGVSFSIYDISGRVGISENTFPDLDLSTARETMGRITHINDQKNLAYDSVLVPLTVDGEIVGYASASIALSIIFQRTVQTIEVLIWIGLCIIIVILVAFIPFVDISIARPLTNFARVFKDVSEGKSDLNVRLKANTQNEIGELAAAFNTMAEKIELTTTDLKNAESALRESNLDLEKRVIDRTKELKEAQTMALESAHAAGMAEISTGMLHNIGNIVNSVNISTEELAEITASLKVKELNKANQLLQEQLPNLAHFFTEDPRGKALISYYSTLGEAFKLSQDKQTQEILRMRKQLSLINDVISTQQQYAKKDLYLEVISLKELLEDVLNLQEKTLENHHIQIIKNIPKDDFLVKIQRVKIAHVLMNLIKNAIEAMESIPADERILTLTIERLTNSEVCIKVIDKGCGISQENLTKIFIHGFTTKQTGHGFGLHSCANAMTEIGGRLEVNSPGPNQGAEFVMIFKISQ